jgi:hypothetical protein
MQFNKTSISNSRRKLLYWAAGTFSGLLLWRFNKQVPKQESVPVKMLTEDGQLVQVDPRFLASGGRKIKKEEIQTWIKRKS